MVSIPTIDKSPLHWQRVPSFWRVNYVTMCRGCKPSLKKVLCFFVGESLWIFHMFQVCETSWFTHICLEFGDSWFMKFFIFVMILSISIGGWLFHRQVSWKQSADTVPKCVRFTGKVQIHMNYCWFHSRFKGRVFWQCQAMLEEARKKLPEVPFEARVVPWKQTAMVGFCLIRFCCKLKWNWEMTHVFCERKWQWFFKCRKWIST